MQRNQYEPWPCLLTNVSPQTPMKINKGPQEQASLVKRFCVNCKGGREGPRDSGRVVSQRCKEVALLSIKHLRFCAGPPFGPGVLGNAVKLLSQVYWSPGFLEREVIYPLVI